MSYIDTYQTTWLPRWEDVVAWLYRDSVGLATTGVGFMQPNLAASRKLPWVIADGSRLATPDEVTADWNRVMALAADRLPKFYHSASGLFLTSDSITSIARSLLTTLDAQLNKDYPTYAGAPDEAKIAVLDMGWNCGEPTLRLHYPHFDADFDNSDWVGCSQQDTRDGNNPAFNDRNAWTKWMFLCAAAEAAGTSLPPQPVLS